MRKSNLLLFFSYIFLPKSVLLAPFDVSNSLQLLSEFGIENPDFGDSSRVTLSNGKRTGDSPIYYIKLPPMPHYYHGEPIPRRPPTLNTFHQLEVDFTNNGKPAQIYHWNYKPHVPMNTPDMIHPSSKYNSASPPHISNEVYNAIAMPPEIPLIKSAKPLESMKKPTSLMEKPLISLKNFIYNGKPSKVYIWKPRPSVRTIKYKHPYFKHFNY